MNNNYKYHSTVATKQCEILASNEHWIWEELYAKSIVEKCIDIILRGITRKDINTEEYKRSIQHITDIKGHFGC